MTGKTAHRRRGIAIASALAGALALTACGSGSSDDKKDAESTSGKTRTIATAMGEVAVPAEPKRVVTLDTAELDSVITLGVKPVGATRTDSSTGFPAHLPADKVEGVKIVGEMTTPNLEAIAALKPDLILTSKLRHGDKYAELKQIAPTVMTETTGAPWKANFLVHAQALGKEAEGQKVIADYSARTAEVTEALGGKEKAAEIEVNMVRFSEGRDIRVYGKENFIGSLFADVGLGRPALTDQAKDGFMVEVSPEKIDSVDTDVIFHSTIGDPDKAKATQVFASPLWKNLQANKNGKVHQVQDELWIQAIGYTGAGKVLEELQAKLTQ
jgi:iron complex transport system substrate-binding protein